MRLRASRGFTLVELMIVVAIIGILAAIAIPNFMSFRNKAKTAEAKANLGGIRHTQNAYWAEYNSYVGNQPEVPIVRSAAGAGVRNVKQRWGAAGRASRFSILGFAPDGDVYYSYSMDGADFPAAGYTVHAVGDLDDDGFTADYAAHNTSPELVKTGALW